MPKMPKNKKLPDQCYLGSEKFTYKNLPCHNRLGSKNLKYKNLSGSQGTDSKNFALAGGEQKAEKIGAANHTDGDAPPRPAIRVPGAAAGTYEGRSIFNSMMRNLLKSQCGFGRFARSSIGLAEPSVALTEPSSKGFPLPLPYPEAFRKGWKASAEEVSRKKMMNCCIICLNYLHLGRPSNCPANLKAGNRLSKSQWSIVRRLEVFLDDWISCEKVGPSAMGRTAPKVKSLEEMLEKLSQVARELPKLGVEAYFPTTYVSPKLGSSKSDAGLVVGQLNHAPFSTFKPVDPARLKFTGRPEFDPVPFLDPISAEVYNSPLQCSLDPGDFVGAVPFVQVHCSPEKKLELFNLLDHSGRLALHPPSAVRPKFAAGLFSVVKNLEYDRLILDSRPSNLLEQPLQRWVRSLASSESLCRLFIPPNRKILTSSNDLKDFYYLFKISEERSRKNILAGPITPSQASSFSCFREEFWEEEKLYGSLCTLAMGDSQAVGLAQTCHLSLALRSGVRSDQLLTLSGQIPRGPNYTGIVIDDFVSLAEVSREAILPSASAAEADRMYNTYATVKLIPNKEKACRDETKATFWGSDFDGDRGLCRGTLSRAIPLAGLVLRVCQLGHSTVELLQIICGSLVSLFLYRRRLLSLMDAVFQSSVDRKGEEIVKLSGRALGELLMMVVLLPFACTNLRAQFRNRISATDASDVAEAGVRATIPCAVAQELCRHSLKKSVWSKLLPPGKAWFRARGLLDPLEELPEGEEPIQTNPLWECLARSLQYRRVFATHVKSRRHINIGELRAFLRMESINGFEKPCSRELYGLDSQVVLGAVCKGRSSSAALNRELTKSLGNMLGLELYDELMYFETSLNPADDPTRGKAVREAVEAPPFWWPLLERQEFQKFDAWLEANGLGFQSISGLPDFSELYSETTCFSDSTAPFVESRACSDFPGGSYDESFPAAWDDSSLPVPSKTGEACRSRMTDHAESLPHAKSLEAAVANFLAAFSCDHHQMTVAEAETCVRFLRRLDVNQFHSKFESQFFPSRPGYLDLYSGEKGIAKEIACHSWCATFELLDGIGQDLSDEQLRDDITSVTQAGLFWGVGASPVCASFSVAITPPVRTSLHPEGIPEMSEKMKVKVLEGNSSVAWLVALLCVCLGMDIIFWLENPAGSWMFKQPIFKAFLEKYLGKCGFWICDYCRFGTAWRKRTKFLTSSLIKDSKTCCNQKHRHLLLRGRSPFHRKSWTLVAQAYPKGVVKTVSKAMMISANIISKPAKFSSSCFARCNTLRIGEALNPGPKHNRDFLLENVSLISARTQALQSKIWEWFVQWSNGELGRNAASSIRQNPVLCAMLVKEFGNHLFSTGKSLYILRHLVVYIQKSQIEVRPYLGICRDLIQKWELVEPPVHRVPLPLGVLKSMTMVALSWKWFRFAGAIVLAFYGITRPGEVLRGTRADLVLPEDLLSDQLSKVYFRIREPKSRRRGKGRIQHASIDSEEICNFLRKVFGQTPHDALLYPISESSFRRRWNAICQHLGILKEHNLTPGSLRAGGAVYEYQRSANLTNLLWRMRIQHLGTLENYVQEVACQTFVGKLSPHSRHMIQLLAALFDSSLGAFKCT